MPYQIIQNKDLTYMVIKSKTGRIHSYRTSLAKAEAQVRLLESRLTK